MAWKKHCALYGMDTTGIEDRPRELEIVKGNIKFPIGKPLSREILATLVARRVIDIERE